MSETEPAVIDRRYSRHVGSGLQGNRQERPAQARRLDAGAAAGFYESKDFVGRYPRLQILTLAELLAGKKLEYPAHRVETFAKAVRKSKHEQEELF